MKGLILRIVAIALLAMGLLRPAMAGETLLDTYTANDTTYFHNFTGFNGGIDHYRLRFKNLIRHNALHPDTFPGQETIVFGVGTAGLSLCNCYSSAAIWYGAPPPTLAPIANFLNAPTGALFTVDVLPPAYVGMSGDVDIYDVGNGAITYTSFITRQDGGGSQHISVYGGSFLDPTQPGARLTAMQLIHDLNQDPAFTFKSGIVQLFAVSP